MVSEKITMRILILLVTSFVVNANGKEQQRDGRSVSRKTRNAVFPDGASQGIFLALSTPIPLPGRLLSLSYNYEANYALPSNATQFTNPFGQESASKRRTSRSLDRRHVYLSLEKRMKSKGLNGRACILRTICETAETNLQHNGLVGDLMHILFTTDVVGFLPPSWFAPTLACDLIAPDHGQTEKKRTWRAKDDPSTSRNKKLHPSFREAENQGKQGVNCRTAYPECPVGLYEFVTILDH